MRLKQHTWNATFDERLASYTGSASGGTTGTWSRPLGQRGHGAPVAAALTRAGHQVLAARRAGQAVGDGRPLNAAQEKEVCPLIANQLPDQLQLSFALWLRKAAAPQQATRYSLKLPVRTSARYEAGWGPLMNYFLPGLKLKAKQPEKSAWKKRGEPARRRA